MTNTDSLADVYHSLFQYHRDACYVLDTEGNFTLFNKTAADITGYSKEEALQLSFHSMLSKDCYHTASIFFQKVLSGNQEQFETTILHKSGRKIDMAITGVPIYLDEKVIGVAGMAQDMTEKKNLSTLLKGQNKILELVTKGCSFSEIMKQVVYLVEKVSDGVMGSIHLKDRKENLLHLCAAPNLPGDYKNFVKEIPIGPNSGSCGTAAYKKVEIICPDIAHDILWREYKEMALKDGLHACWSSPVFDNQNNVIGVFAMYYDKLCIPTDWNRKVVKETTYLISLIIQHYYAEEKINFMAFHDELTGLPNRRLFDKKVASAIVNFSTDIPHMLGIMYIDLDRFKIINDSLGHNVGDVLLKKVSERLQNCVREYDVVSRQGGDEFTILLHDVTKLEMSIVGQRILEELSKSFLIVGHEIFITPSIGISIYPGDGMDGAELLRKADMAMYQAKKEGRNNFQFYNPKLSEKSHKRLALENELRKALKSNEFTLYYQPIIDLSTNQLAGTEALIRWNHPRLGTVSPAEFIPIAEETGMIVSIGEWVIKTACQQLTAWEKDSFIIPSIAVNISIRQFYQPDFVNMLKKTLEETEVAPARLTIEITESMTMDVDKAMTILYQLKNLGVNISIDDFGTGYSSLNYLKTFPIDYLKIDQSFVRDITKSANDEKIATTILLMAQNLGLGVIAEGVETLEQLKVLLSHDCNQAQGYLFSKPLSSQEMNMYKNKSIPFSSTSL